MRASGPTAFGRLLALLAIYAVTLVTCWWGAWELRFDFRIPAETAQRVQWVGTWLPLQLVCLYVFGQFRGLLSYFSIPDFFRIAYAMTVAGVVLYMTRYAPPGLIEPPPRGVLLINLVLTIVALSGVRLGFRMYRERHTPGHTRTPGRRRRVAIVGAGDVGANLARELLARPALGMLPVVFFDDDPAKWSSSVHGVPVMGGPELLADQRLNLRLEEAVIAMPSATPKRVGEVVRLLNQARLKSETVPSLDQLATGRVRVTQLRPVQIEDLLGRDQIELETESIQALLSGHRVLVTGAGGSIGSELCRQVASFKPERLLLVEQSEVQMFQIEQELRALGCGQVIVPLVADILNEERMRALLQRWKPAVIFHAAAHKHVPMMESQPEEAIRNNSFGTARLAELALEWGVERFVMISTDKAINPTNVMGATKRLAEIYIQALQAANPGRTRFMAVRFGNVLGSSGSVVPVFQRQISEGGPVTVTHPEVKRYFMTIPEAVGLVLQSATQGTGGEIFVLDMGKPVKIVDLARQMIELSGLRPDVDVEIRFVGLRPGEKLFEELSYGDENHTPTPHPKIMRFISEPESLVQVLELFSRIEAKLYSSAADDLKLLLKVGVPEYQPELKEGGTKPVPTKTSEAATAPLAAGSAQLVPS